jgi:hypothetical protein
MVGTQQHACVRLGLALAVAPAAVMRARGPARVVSHESPLRWTGRATPSSRTLLMHLYPVVARVRDDGVACPVYRRGSREKQLRASLNWRETTCIGSLARIAKRKLSFFFHDGHHGGERVGE